MQTLQCLRPLRECQRLAPRTSSSIATTILTPASKSISRPHARSFLSNPFSDNVQTLTATRTLPYPAKAIYNIIADVPAYSRFLPYCKSSSVTQVSSPDANGKTWPSEAEIVVGWGDISESFRSKIYCVPETVVEAVGGSARTTLTDEKISHHLKSQATTPSGQSSGQPSLLARSGLFRSGVASSDPPPNALEPPTVPIQATAHRRVQLPRRICVGAGEAADGSQS